MGQIIKYKINQMTFDDLGFFLSIRNECSEFLHDNRKFSMEECEKWFNATNPYYFIINYNGNDIGYFRTSNHIGSSIYIGCDLHKDWRGKKLAYNAYITFMKYLFNEQNINIIELEVLDTNKVAYNLYKKLGFSEINRDRKILRNNVNISSILMLIKKEDFNVRL